MNHTQHPKHTLGSQTHLKSSYSTPRIANMWRVTSAQPGIGQYIGSMLVLSQFTIRSPCFSPHLPTYHLSPECKRQTSESHQTSNTLTRFPNPPEVLVLDSSNCEHVTSHLSAPGYRPVHQLVLGVGGCLRFGHCYRQSVDVERCYDISSTS